MKITYIFCLSTIFFLTLHLTFAKDTTSQAISDQFAKKFSAEKGIVSKKNTQSDDLNKDLSCNITFFDIMI